MYDIVLLQDEREEEEEKKVESFSFISAPPKIKDDWLCPICKKIVRDPKSLNGDPKFTFCSKCIAGWWRICDDGNRPRTNPMTNLPITTSDRLIPAKQISKDIKYFFEQVAITMNERQTFYRGPMGRYSFPPQRAMDAQDFFNEHLAHLKPEYQRCEYFTEWIVEKFYGMWHAFDASNVKTKEDFKNELDKMRIEAYQSLEESFERAEQAIDSAESPERAEAIIRQAQVEVSF